MKLALRLGLLLLLGSSPQSWGGMAITYAGKTLVADYRTTSLVKPLDPDGNNVFGTAGYVLYGTDVIGNGNNGSVPSTDPLNYSSGTRATKKSLPAWLTLINNGQGAVASSYDVYPYADDPAAFPNPSVADVQLGFAIRLLNPFGTEASLVNLRFEAGRPATGVRVGIICMASGNDVMDYVTLTNNLDAGAAVTRVGADNPTIYFFDVNGANVSDIVTLRMRKDASSGGNANLAYLGLTFDVLPDVPGPPTVVITRPADNSVYTVPLKTTISADATDSDVTNVAFYLNGLKFGDVRNPPFALTWNNVTVGSKIWTAVASDSTGLRGTSAVVHVTSVNPAMFRITKSAQSNATTTLTWQSQPTLHYQVEIATNLAPPIWMSIGPNVISTNALSSASFAASPDDQRFFRVRLNTTAPQPSVASYSLPSCYTVSTQLSLTADASPVPVIDCSVEFKNYDYCTFSCAGTNVITLTASEDIVSYSISPLTSGIMGTVNGKTLQFTLDSPRYLIVKINNLRELVIAADALEANVPPSFGPGIHNVALPPYSADPAGSTITTVAIQAAIDDASNAGGGTVVVPEGVYKCGNLVLKNNVAIYLAGGAVIRGTGNPADYTTRFRKDSLSMDGTWFISTAPNATNITIHGRGTIDGNGSVMRNLHGYLNNLVVPLQCSRFTMDGIILRDSGGWALMVTRSDNVLIQNTKHFNNNELDYENDAIDVQESQNVVVKHTIAVSEDDTYSVKTWSSTTDIAANWPGTSEVATNIIFEDCVAWSRTGAFKIGQGIFQPQSNIAFKNSSVYRCMYAVAVIYKNGTVGARDITFANIDVEGFWPRSGNLGRWLNAEISSGGSITNLIVANVTTRNPDETGSVLRGFNSTSQFYGVQLNGNSYNGVHGTNFSSLHITVTNAFVSNLIFQ